MIRSHDALTGARVTGGRRATCAGFGLLAHAPKLKPTAAMLPVVRNVRLLMEHPSGDPLHGRVWRILRRTAKIGQTCTVSADAGADRLRRRTCGASTGMMHSLLAATATAG